MTGRRFGAGPTILVAIVMVTSLWVALGTNGAASIVPAPPASAHGALSAHPTALSTPPPRVHPSTVPCPPPPPIIYPAYHAVGNGYPLQPDFSSQGNCAPLGNDQVHASFFSNVAGSGTHFTIPLYLPALGTQGQPCNYNDVYVGIVVGGDGLSINTQSYAVVSFTPNVGCQNQSSNTLTYSENAMVWGLFNASKMWPATAATFACPNGGESFTRDSAYYCEQNQVNAGSGSLIASSLPSATWYNLTFVGGVGPSNPLGFFENTSASVGASHSYTFNALNTSNHTYYPYYHSSCLDACLLNWSTSFGLGLGADLCSTYNPTQNPACNSYNQYNWESGPPVAWGVPHFYTAGAWRGDYATFAPESTSGVCNSFAAAGTVAPCYNADANGGTGYYPTFTFNGTSLNFGTSWPWTTENFGTAIKEYQSNTYQKDFTPFWVDHDANSSRGGFVTPGSSVNVSARVQDLGNVSSVSLNYQLPNAAWSNVSMVRKAGTPTYGIYNATIPGSGGNGLIHFYISAVNNASVTAFLGHNDTVSRGPLPHFQVLLQTTPGNCGNVWFNGTAYRNNTYLSELPGVYAVKGNPCWPYVFFNWSRSGGVVLGSYNQTTQALVTSNGTLDVILLYIRPTDNITVATSPAICGTVNIDGNAYTNGQTLGLLDNLPNTIGLFSGCGGYVFGGWGILGNFTILGRSLTPHGNGTIIANFIPSGTAVQVLFQTSPTSCGGIGYNNTGYVNGENLNFTPGTYAIAPLPCAHYGFLKWNASAGVSVAGSSMTVTSAGVVREVNYHLTEVTLVTVPGFCGYITFDGTNYRNGSVVVVQNNSTHLISAVSCTNYYFFGFNTTPGLSVSGHVFTINYSGVLKSINIPGTSAVFIGFITDPPFCGTINFESSTFVNANYTYVPPGTVAPISANTCRNYGFVTWITTGGITIVGGNAYVNTSGSIDAVFRPLADVFLYTDPAGCGSIDLGGRIYGNNATATVPETAVFSLAAIPCTGYALTAWENSSGATITGSNISFATTSILTAVFTQVGYTVGFTINPPNCGDMTVQGRVVVNGSTFALSRGVYAIKATPCAGDHLAGWSTNGSVNVSGSHLYVNGSGNVTATFQPVPPSVSLSVPTGSFTGLPVSFIAAVAVLVPPYNYTYQWAFGDGSPPETTFVNFTDHVYGHTGTFAVGVTVTDGFNRTAHANSTVSVVAQNTTSAGSTLIPGLTAIGLALGVLLVALAFVGYWRRRHPATEAEPAAPPPPATTDELDVSPEEMETKP
ncbi:MAG: PKD domain-containing protein [Thermoplasmata archaeon]|nr:PKD domain-containing protein [Thermoplasmata archaeon]